MFLRQLEQHRDHYPTISCSIERSDDGRDVVGHEARHEERVLGSVDDLQKRLLRSTCRNDGGRRSCPDELGRLPSHDLGEDIPSGQQHRRKFIGAYVVSTPSIDEPIHNCSGSGRVQNARKCAYGLVGIGPAKSVCDRSKLLGWQLEATAATASRSSSMSQTLEETRADALQGRNQ